MGFWLAVPFQTAPGVDAFHFNPEFHFNDCGIERPYSEFVPPLARKIFRRGPELKGLRGGEGGSTQWPGSAGEGQRGVGERGKRVWWGRIPLLSNSASLIKEESTD